MFNTIAVKVSQDTILCSYMLLNGLLFGFNVFFRGFICLFRSP
jgi:hypothetical protein